MRSRFALASLALLLVHCTPAGSAETPASGDLKSLPADLRLEYLREAAVWSPIDTGSLDLRAGPAGDGAVPGQVLTCDFVLPDEPPGGHTPKFLCRTSDGEVHKIKYGRDNPEVYGEIIGSRLLWALGFPTDRIDPVRVRCRGCPDDPWGFLKGWWPRRAPPPEQVREFDPAIIETYYGLIMESEPDQGVGWDELLGLHSRDPARAREQVVQRQALALLMGFLQHTDSKPSQQALSCRAEHVERKPGAAERCRRPEIYVSDVGAILGQGWSYLGLTTSKFRYGQWQATPVWRDPEACVVAVNARPNASLRDVAISEPARRFLAERLRRLRREQLRSLFALAQVELLGETRRDAIGARQTVDADDWSDLFLEKARAVIEHRCPKAPPDEPR